MTTKRRVLNLMMLLFLYSMSSLLFQPATHTTTTVQAAPPQRPRPPRTPTPTPTSTPSPTPTPTCTTTNQLISSPNGAVDTNQLNNVEAIASNDIWAVGSYGSPLQHWDGNQWTNWSLPTGGTQLFGLTARSSQNVWAAGSYNNGFPQALAARWDGQNWTIIPGTETGTGSQLYDIAALSDQNIWTVGGSFSPATNNWEQPLIEHWDGQVWTVVALPSFGTTASLRSIAAVSPNDIWAVGMALEGNWRTLILHWDGQSWARVTSPNSGIYGNYLFDVVALSATNIWAVGSSNNGQRTLIMRWNGQSWSIVPSPNVSADGNRLLSIAADTSNDIWAVGYSSVSYSSGEDLITTNTSLALHWDGANWHVAPSPNLGPDSTQFAGVDVIQSQAWVVGSYTAASFPTVRTLVVRFTCQ